MRLLGFLRPAVRAVSPIPASPVRPGSTADSYRPSHSARPQPPLSPLALLASARSTSLLHRMRALCLTALQLLHLGATLTSLFTEILGKRSFMANCGRGLIYRCLLLGRWERAVFGTDAHRQPHSSKRGEIEAGKAVLWYVSCDICYTASRSVWRETVGKATTWKLNE